MHTKNPDLFRFHLLVSFSVARYLICNTPGRQDGAEKAEVHKDLCEKFIEKEVQHIMYPYDVVKMKEWFTPGNKAFEATAPLYVYP